MQVVLYLISELSNTCVVCYWGLNSCKAHLKAQSAKQPNKSRPKVSFDPSHYCPIWFNPTYERIFMSSWSVYFVRFVAVVRDRCWRWWFLGYRMQYSNTPTSTSTSTLGHKSSCNMTQAQPWSAIPPQSQASDECRRVLTHPPLGLNLNFLYEYIFIYFFSFLYLF